MINIFQEEETEFEINILIFFQELLKENFQNLEEFEKNNFVKKIIEIFSEKFQRGIFTSKLNEFLKDDISQWEILEIFIKFIFDNLNYDKKIFFEEFINFSESLRKKRLLEILVIFSYLDFFEDFKWEKICENFKQKKNLKILETVFKNKLVSFFKENYFSFEKKKKKNLDSKKNFKKEKKFFLENVQNENFQKSELEKDLVYYKEFKKLAEKSLIENEKEILLKEKEISKLKNLIKEKKEISNLKITPKKNLEKKFFSLKNLKKSFQSSILFQEKTEPYFKKKNCDWEKRSFYYKNLSLNLIKELKIFYTEFRKFLILSNFDLKKGFN